MPAPNRRPALLHLARAALATAVVATAIVAAAVLAAPTPAADAANRYRVEITNLRSGLKADVMWASKQPFQGVFLWPNNTSASQEFDLLDSGDGYFRIRARHSGQCLMLDWRGGTYANGTPVIQYPPATRATRPPSGAGAGSAPGGSATATPARPPAPCTRC